jgi:magnesium transporter
LTTLKHAAGPLQEYIGKLHGGRVPEICTRTQDYFRDIDDHLSRINQSIDNQRDMVVTGTLVNLSLISLQESEIVKRLAAYAALVAVPTMIAGVYGMNFDHMPELKWIYGYPLSLAMMVGIDVWLYLKFRKAKWL